MMAKSALCFFLLSPALLSGCTSSGKSGAIDAIYLFATALSLLLFACLIFVLKVKDVWLRSLFVSVTVVNLGYTCLANSTTLNAALWANRLSYLGSVFLPLSILMLLFPLTGTKKPRALLPILLSLAGVMFLLTASAGVLPLYYKEISLETVRGVSFLKKVYGPLHPLYLLYLLGYIASMVFIIARAARKKTTPSTAHAMVLMLAVLGNLGIWFIEQIVHFDFEMLSLSYIFTELFLLGLRMLTQENHHLSGPLSESQKRPVLLVNFANDSPSESISEERLSALEDGIARLTAAEREIFCAHLSRRTTSEIVASLHITENTLKYHNKNIYSKLGVSSKQELLKLCKHLPRAPKEGQ